MFEKVIPILVALIALQFIIRVMQKKKASVPKSEWREIDYKKRIDDLMKGRDPEGTVRSPKGITLIGIEDFSAIPDDKRDVRRDILHIREAVSIGLRSKLGRDVSDSKYREPDLMFDDIVRVIERYTKKEES
ncbi:MAG TPA: hypothetical protein P5120_13660 [Spirochaetota bacterium]|nr:hypothetical protein [Spirochaetota bacterium]HPF06723.1 hypothetical protein [Spirochaetota bacterium]HPJ43305.1 hypothetical protein [Spirochaetota bacterium]HPR38656.1 hypothetical protein [Spirochaetota bacterium]HRX48560.1 hypothetical protein [Spirochaetota bacterium]